MARAYLRKLGILLVIQGFLREIQSGRHDDVNRCCFSADIREGWQGMEGKI